MNNKVKNRVEIIRGYVKNMPYFRIENLLTIDDNKRYLKVLLSRMSKSEEIIRIKRGFYVHRDYLIEVRVRAELDNYYEFIACEIFENSYLSLEYVLSEYGVLSEAVYGYSLVSVKKTNKIDNSFGRFINHSIKKDLLLGYQILKNGKYTIKKASLAKALFDFLYFRKNILANKEVVIALRLNLEILKKNDVLELKKYIKLEKSKKMFEIFKWLDL